MAAVSLFWNTNMAAVTSPENALYPGARFSYNLQQDSNRRRILTFLRSQENFFSSMTDRILRKVIASITRSIWMFSCSRLLLCLEAKPNKRGWLRGTHPQPLFCELSLLIYFKIVKEIKPPLLITTHQKHLNSFRIKSAHVSLIQVLTRLRICEIDVIEINLKFLAIIEDCLLFLTRWKTKLCRRNAW